MGDCLKFRVPGKPDVTVRVGDDMPDAVVEIITSLDTPEEVGAALLLHRTVKLQELNIKEGTVALAATFDRGGGGSSNAGLVAVVRKPVATPVNNVLRSYTAPVSRR